MGKRRGIYRVLVEAPDEQRPLGRPSHRWEDNIKMELQKLDVGAWNGPSLLRIGTGGGHM
jgi:hypothetical protein